MKVSEMIQQVVTAAMSRKDMEMGDEWVRIADELFTIKDRAQRQEAREPKQPITEFNANET